MAQLPVTVNLDAYQGDSWLQTFRLKQNATPLDLTGAQVSSQCRGPGATLFQIPVTVNPTAGEVTIKLPTGIKAGGYYYDIQVVFGAAITTWITGKLNIAPEVTV